MMLGKRWCWVGMGMRLLNYWWFRWDMNTNSLVRDLNGCHKLPLAELAKKYRDLTRSSVHILLHSTPGRGIPSLVATVIWHWTLSSTALINLICTSRITNDYCTEIHSQDICTSCITNVYCIGLRSDIEKYLSCYPQIHAAMYIPLNAAIVVQVYTNMERGLGRFLPYVLSQHVM